VALLAQAAEVGNLLVYLNASLMIGCQIQLLDGVARTQNVWQLLHHFSPVKRLGRNLAHNSEDERV
jgi:hypothetical protein